jgi:Ca-activated chloride channel family protein
MTSTKQAELLNSQGETLMLEGVTAIGRVQGRMLQMSLEQRFRNTGQANTEVTYTFPLPWGAVLMAVDVELNGKRLSGQVAAKKFARAQYEEALSDGNTSVLLEHNPDRSYTMELGNLLASEACVITVRYAQVLQLEHGQLRLMLQTVIAPRYGNALTQGRLQPHQVAKTDLTAEYTFDISITICGPLAQASLACLSHKTAYSPGKDGLIVTLAQKGSLDRDFILVMSDLPQMSVGIASPDSLSPGHTAVMVSFSPNTRQPAMQPVTTKILVDCSGSMQGDSIAAARAALQSIVMGLGKPDRFTLSRFGDSVEHRSRGMWTGLTAAKASGLRWVEQLKADMGGTEMANALVSTIALGSQGTCDILLITDGEIEGIDEVIAAARTSGHRMFVVGIGASPAEAHLRRLSQATGGACDFVAPGENVEPAVIRMFSRLRTPQAQGLKVEWPAEWHIEWASDPSGSAFGGDALTLYAFVAGGISEAASARVKLWGHVDGESEHCLLATADVNVHPDASNTLARMVGQSRYLQLASAEHANADLKTRAIDLAVKYQLVTDETNFILVHERAEHEKPLEMPGLHSVPHMLAAGWGGAGSVRSHASRQTVDHAPPMQILRCAADANASYGSLGTPSVWRGRTAAAAKVDALSGDGMDDYEIPAFLRKDADGGWSAKRAPEPKQLDKDNPDFWANQPPAGLSSAQVDQWRQANPAHLQPVVYVGLTPAGVVEWLNLNPASKWPATFMELRRIELGVSVCEWLEFVVGEKRDEREVVLAFLQVMLTFEFNPPKGLKKLAKLGWSALNPASKKRAGLLDQADALLVETIFKGLQGVKVREWPDAIVNFAEADDPN